MSNSNTTRLTREEFLGIIDNYRNHGRDITELERALQEAFPGILKNDTTTVDARVAELRSQSSVTEGNCSVCGAKGTLLGGVCEACFLPWATKVAEDNIARVRKNKQREKL
jgi:hypothetical protein